MLLCVSLPASAATSIPFTINLSETVTVTGTPRIAVDVGGVARYATYASGSGTSALIFTHAMVAGDVDLDGVTVSSPIDLNGGTIKDTAGNDATLIFTPPNTTNVKVNYPSLGMDFTNGATGRYTLNGTAYTTLPSFLTATGGTFSRNSIGTYYDTAGILQTATANTPRFDYDPITHAAKGILIEESRTNLAIRSDEFDNAIWTKTNLSVLPNTITAPDGSLTADKINESASTSTHEIGQGFGIGTDTYLSFTVFVKAAERQFCYIRISGNTKRAGVSVDLSSGVYNFTTQSNAINASASVTAVGGGWWKINITAQSNYPTAPGWGNALISASDTYISNVNTVLGSGLSYAGNSSSGIYIWGAQLEQGSFPTSYIPTTTAAVTRAADDLTIPTPGWFSATNGTLNGEATSLTNGNGSQILMSIGVDTGNMIGIRQRGTPDIIVMARGTGSNDGGAWGVNLNTKNKFATWYSDGLTGAYSSNGSAASTAAVFGAGNGATYTTLGVGRFPNGGGQWNGPIQKIKYYPLRVSNTQLQLMTQ